MTAVPLTTRPEAPRDHALPIGQAGVTFTTARHHFDLTPATDLDTVLAEVDRPLSVIFQVTRLCNFHCQFCSETLQLPDPTLEQVTRIRDNLADVPRVFLSGGEPMLRPDLPAIAELFKEAGTIVGLPTNATRGLQMAGDLPGLVDFVNIGLDGPRAITNRVRGDYDKVMRGIWAFQRTGLPLALSAVVLRSTMHGLPYLLQLADAIGAGKVKLIAPIRKGEGLSLHRDEFLTQAEYEALFDRLADQRAQMGWTPALRMTTWTPATEGYSILVWPNGRTYAWPVYEAETQQDEDRLAYLGNLFDEPVTVLWGRYGFKRNHYAKYLGRSIRVTRELEAI
jgi:MoaA/NifB/PqqE/SkfB family radical SAM enzyme